MFEIDDWNLFDDFSQFLSLIFAATQHIYQD